MPDRLQTTVVRFDAAARGRPVAAEIEPGFAPFLQLYLRVYPADAEQVAVSRGSLTLLSYEEIERTETLQFQGSDFASLRLWTAQSPIIEYQTVFFDALGNPLNGAGFTWDPARNGFRASEPLYGVLRVRYRAKCARYNYRFDTTRLTGGGLTVHGGLLIVRDGMQVATLDLDPPGLGDEEGVVELYRVVSEVVTDPDGTWEKPPNFPTDSDYPGGGTGPDTNIYMISERTHEVGVIDLDSRIDERRLHTPWEQPYTGSVAYRPGWRLKRGSPPTGFETAFLNVDWGRLEAALKDRYPGLQT